MLSRDASAQYGMLLHAGLFHFAAALSLCLCHFLLKAVCADYPFPIAPFVSFSLPLADLVIATAGPGPRRSGRVRKPVKTYADEQADESDLVSGMPTRTRKRKPAHNDDDDADDFELAIADPKPATTSSVKSEAKGGDDEEPGEKSKPSKIPRTRSDSSWHGDAAESRIISTKKQVKRLRPGESETRLRGFVHEPHKSYNDFLKRANTQRMYIIDRERGIEDSCHANHDDCPCERLQIAGSTGNVYTVTISHLPSCTCPVGLFTRKGDEKLCKHALYVLHHVLKAPAHLQKQNAFLTAELREVFAQAPAMASTAIDEPLDGNRKPVDDECPICCMDFADGEDLVWCQAACGNNLHRVCFDKWAQAKARVTCPFCRSVWQYDAPKKSVQVNRVTIPTVRGLSGYRNVRDQLDYEDLGDDK